jgi:hypothetical protein
MRTVKVEVYKLKELPAEAQDKVINEMANINVDYNWWDITCDDAANIGLSIESFDIRRSIISGSFNIDCHQVVDRVLRDHGEKCETYKTAEAFNKDWSELVEKYSDGMNKKKVADDNNDLFDEEATELETEFRRLLCRDYLLMLGNEYEYLCSREVIVETIEANEYEFTIDGKLFNHKP